jgi:hypothetical protein
MESTLELPDEPTKSPSVSLPSSQRPCTSASGGSPVPSPPSASPPALSTPPPPVVPRSPLPSLPVSLNPLFSNTSPLLDSPNSLFSGASSIPASPNSLFSGASSIPASPNSLNESPSIRHTSAESPHQQHHSPSHIPIRYVGTAQSRATSSPPPFASDLSVPGLCTESTPESPGTSHPQRPSAESPPRPRTVASPLISSHFFSTASSLPSLIPVRRIGSAASHTSRPSLSCGFGAAIMQSQASPTPASLSSRLSSIPVRSYSAVSPDFADERPAKLQSNIGKSRFLYAYNDQNIKRFLTQ